MFENTVIEIKTNTTRYNEADESTSSSASSPSLIPFDGLVFLSFLCFLLFLLFSPAFLIGEGIGGLLLFNFAAILDQIRKVRQNT
jgi:hypothetical protein